jgi:glycosyltransferase involved in cell wall biosynthesis
MQRAKAFVFAACEDFGIAPVEAQACGIPIIAYGRGGVLETVIEGKTGMFFEEQSPEAIADAITGFEQCQDQFDPMVIRANAQRFSIDRFKTEVNKFVLQKIEEYFKAPPSGPTRKLHLRNRRGTKSRIPGEEILKNL